MTTANADPMTAAPPTARLFLRFVLPGILRAPGRARALRLFAANVLAAVATHACSWDNGRKFYHHHEPPPRAPGRHYSGPLSPPYATHMAAWKAVQNLRRDWVGVAELLAGGLLGHGRLRRGRGRQLFAPWPAPLTATRWLGQPPESDLPLYLTRLGRAALYRPVAAAPHIGTAVSLGFDTCVLRAALNIWPCRPARHGGPPRLPAGLESWHGGLLPRLAAAVEQLLPAAAPVGWEVGPVPGHAPGVGVALRPPGPEAARFLLPVDRAAWLARLADLHDHAVILADALEDAGVADAGWLVELRGAAAPCPDCGGTGHAWPPPDSFPGGYTGHFCGPCEGVGRRNVPTRGWWAVDPLLGRRFAGRSFGVPLRHVGRPLPDGTAPCEGEWEAAPPPEAAGGEV